MEFKVGDRARLVGQGCHVNDNGENPIVEITSVDGSGWTSFKRVDNSDSCGDRAILKGESHELQLITNGDNKVEQGRRTFKLLKDSPTMKKGALLQEESDDGTQPYIMLNQDTHCLDPSYNISIRERSIVEEQPQWFQEVFKVTPEYMTREELDAFEAFKKGSKVTKRSYVKAAKRVVNGHMSHASPRNPGIYRAGSASLSYERMEEFLDAHTQGRGERVRIAKIMNVKPGTVDSYKSIAKKNGLL